MHIDRRTLNLVLPMQTPSGKVWVHSMPISREVFERYFLVMSKAMAALFSEGLNVVAGPGVAALMLKAVAEQMGIWDDVQAGLLNEMRRLTKVVVLGAEGWETLPLQTAVTRELLSDEDAREAEGTLVFFMLISSVNKRNQVPALLAAAGALWGFQTSLLSSTDWVASLPISTEGEISSSEAKTLATAQLITKPAEYVAPS